MLNYILERLKNDALHLLKAAENEEKVAHLGLRGRFRELLVDNLLSPWLPPYVSCGTGIIISQEDIKRNHTQDDIILFDRSLTPPILASNNLREGAFLFNSVLARIEVKSCITLSGFHNFCESSQEMSRMKFSARTNFETPVTGPLNLLFAYKSDISGDELPRFTKKMVELGINPTSGIISIICIPGKGLWKIGQNNTWQKLNFEKPEEHIAWFIACISNSCFNEHIKRQGREIDKSLEMGIGTYIPGDVYSDIDISNFITL